MDKRLVYPQNLNKERDLFLLKEDRNYLRKHASGYHPQISSYIEKAKPIEGLIQVLLTALGATPFWPQNVNGDDFPESALSNPGDDFGYKTFTSNANYFTHHVNKDPALAKGKVLFSVWNDPSKRVELIIGINTALDPDAGDMVDRGEPLCFSMGAKLPYDVCTICGNKAKTRPDYCDHLRYMMNQIDPESGKLVGAINPHPKFFDISRVLIPADKTAYMWEKLASDGRSNLFSKLGSAQLAELPAGKLADMRYLTKLAEEKFEGRLPKRASVQKRAEIKKQILAVQPETDAKLSALLPRIKTALDAVSPVIPTDVFAGHTLREILVTILSLGMTPTAVESRTLHDLFVGGMPAGEARYSPELAKKLTPLIPHRSFAPPVLLARLQSMLTAPHGSPLHKRASVAMMRHVPRRPEHFDSGMKQGILAALAFLLAPESLKHLVMDHPIPLLLAGAPLLAAGKALTSPEPLVSGEYDLAGGSPDLYNEDWRSRFARMQARPVTVIKTGEDLSHTAQHMMNTWSGLSGLLGFSDVVFDGSNHAASDFGNRFPALFQNSILSKSAQEIGEVARLLKTASDLSGGSVTSFDQLPNTDRIASGECLILQAAEKLTKSLKGENQHG